MELDLIVKNARVFNAYFKKFIDADIYISNGKFLYIGKDDCDLNTNNTIDAKGKYIIPGLIDIHMHIESSMTTPVQFSQAVIQHGVTTLVCDPHEIANVFGLEGIEALINSNTQNTVDIFYGIPSSVPSTSELLETTGGSITVNDVSRLLDNEDVRCLGEVMNYKDLIGDENSLINKIIKEIKLKKPLLRIEGHCPRITGLELAKFIYQGVDADHTQQTPYSLKEKIENGMFMEIQEKSMSQENINFLIENELYEHFCFVTDDVMSDQIQDGHLKKLLANAVKLGISPEMAIYTSTYTPAKRMLLDDRGSISPGKIADFIILEEINEFKVSCVFKNGEIVYDGKVDFSDSTPSFPKHFYESIKLDYLSTSDFEVVSPIHEGEVNCRIIKVQPDTTFTEEIIDKISVRQSRLLWQTSPFCLITVFNRYGKSKNKSFGLVTGSIIKKGAVATSYAHDHHNLMVMGENEKDMVIAANWVIKAQGGYCVVNDGVVLASLALPVGGILSEERIDVVGDKLKSIRNALQNLGYNHHNEIMSFSTISLPVSPNLKLTDKGLIDVVNQKIVSLFC